MQRNWWLDRSKPSDETVASFQTDWLFLRVFGVSVDIAPGCFYRDDGEVDGIYGHSVEVLGEFGLDPRVFGRNEVYSQLHTVGTRRIIHLSLGDVQQTFAVPFILKPNKYRGREAQIIFKAQMVYYAICAFGEDARLQLICRVLDSANFSIDLLNTDFLRTDHLMMAQIMGLIALKLNRYPMDCLNQHDAFRIPYEYFMARVQN